MQPAACAAQVKRRGAHIGIALDGDADRLVVIDELGNQVNGDALIALCARHLLRRNALSKRTVVTTVMSSIGLDRALQREKGKVMRVGVGDRYVVEAMRAHGLTFG